MKLTHQVYSNVIEIFVDGKSVEDTFQMCDDDKILDACEVVLYKWEALSAMEWIRDGGRNSCAFCQMFNMRHMDDFNVCRGCPVFDFTGQPGCEGTPYEEIEYSGDRTKDNHTAMYDFLVKAIAEYKRKL